jgi:hypothetical protein
MATFANNESLLTVREKLNYWLEGIVNVKDYGAVGDGVEDDTDAIREAMNDAVAASVANGGYSTPNRGSVYFPPGVYKVTETIYLWGDTTDPITITQGQGKIWGQPGTVLITANFAGFIFDNGNQDPPTTETNSQFGIFEGLNLRNEHANGGCIRALHNFFMSIRDCNFKAGQFGVIMQGAEDVQCAISSTISNCTFNGLGTEGAWYEDSIGCTMGPNMRMSDCTFFLWENALVVSGAQCAVYSTRFEINDYALRVGQRPAFPGFTAFAMSGGVLENLSFESNRYSMYLNAAGGVTIRDVQSQLVNAGHDSQIDIWLRSVEKCTIQNWNSGGDCDVAGIYFENDLGHTTQRVTFVDCNFGYSTAPVIDDDNADMGGFTAVRCGGIGNLACTVANLPSTWAPAGTTRWVNNANQAVGTDAWGTVITGGGANTVPCWFDGTNWRMGN